MDVGKRRQENGTYTGGTSNIGNGLLLAGDNIDKGKERGGFRIWGSGVTA